MAYNNQKPSKYLRNPQEQKSKYLRDKSEKKSKYMKDKNDAKQHHYNLTRYIKEEDIEEENVDVIEELDQANPEGEKSLDPKVMDMVLEDISGNDDAKAFENFADADSASELEKARSEEDEPSEAENFVSSSLEDKEEEEPEQEETREEEKVQKKGDNASLFKHSGLSKDTTVAQPSNNIEQGKIKFIVSMVITMLTMGALSLLLQYASIKNLPYFPSMLSVEFSVFPELIISIAYGPLFGIIIVFFKNILHILIANNGFASELSNFVLDSTFITIVGLFYSRRMFALPSKRAQRNPNKDRRRTRIFMGGLIGTVVTTVVSFFLTRYVSYPLIINQYSSAGVDEYFIIDNYQKALNEVNSAFPEFFSATIEKIENLSQAVMFFNVPLTFAKFLIVTLVSAIVYVIISPYLHFRKKSK